MGNILQPFFKKGVFILIMVAVVSCTSPTDPREEFDVLREVNLTETAEITSEFPFIESGAEVTSTVSLIVVTPPIIDTPSWQTETPTTVPILTPTPAVDSRAEAMLVQELMETNAGCQLPCWWGISLGENLRNVEMTFTRLGIGQWQVSISDFGDGGARGYVRTGYFDTDNSFYIVDISMDFYTVDDTVQFIEITAERPLSQFGEGIFVRDWEKYFLKSILQKYGIPQSVYLVPQNIADPAPSVYSLNIYYPEIGINASYSFYGQSAGELESVVCLELENVREITLTLYNPALADNWGTYLIPPEFYNDPEVAELFSNWTWEAQTGLDLNDFDTILQDPTILDCINVNLRNDR